MTGRKRSVIKESSSDGSDSDSVHSSLGFKRRKRKRIRKTSKPRSRHLSVTSEDDPKARAEQPGPSRQLTHTSASSSHTGLIPPDLSFKRTRRWPDSQEAPNRIYQSTVKNPRLPYPLSQPVSNYQDVITWLPYVKCQDVNLSALTSWRRMEWIDKTQPHSPIFLPAEQLDVMTSVTGPTNNQLAKQPVQKLNLNEVIGLWRPEKYKGRRRLDFISIQTDAYGNSEYASCWIPYNESRPDINIQLGFGTDNLKFVSNKPSIQAKLGDIKNPAIVAGFISTIDKLTSNGARLLITEYTYKDPDKTSGLHCSSDMLLVAKCLLGVRIVEKGGNFICRIRETFSTYHAGILFLMRMVFNSVGIYYTTSTITTEPDCECYMICKGRRERLEDMCEYLKQSHTILVDYYNVYNGTKRSVCELVPFSILQNDEEFKVTLFNHNTRNALGVERNGSDGQHPKSSDSKTREKSSSYISPSLDLVQMHSAHTNLLIPIPKTNLCVNTARNLETITGQTVQSRGYFRVGEDIWLSPIWSLKSKIICEYPTDGSVSGGKVQISEQDLMRLGPSRFLNYTIVDFWLQYHLREKMSEMDRKRILALSSLTFLELKDNDCDQKLNSATIRCFEGGLSFRDPSLWTPDPPNLVPAQYISDNDFYPDPPHVIYPDDNQIRPIQGSAETPSLNAKPTEPNPSSIPTNPPVVGTLKTADQRNEARLWNKEYIFIPIPESSTWLLAVVYFPDKLQTCGNHPYFNRDSGMAPHMKPLILLFDSYSVNREWIFSKIRSFLNLELKASRSDNVPIFNSENLPGHIVKVPSHQNPCDGGLHMIHCFEHFFTKPLEYFLSPRLLMDDIWFKESDLDGKRERIFNAIRTVIRTSFPDNLNIVSSDFLVKYQLERGK